MVAGTDLICIIIPQLKPRHCPGLFCLSSSTSPNLASSEERAVMANDGQDGTTEVEQVEIRRRLGP
jgi:hypothetical protein